METHNYWQGGAWASFLVRFLDEAVAPDFRFGLVPLPLVAAFFFVTFALVAAAPGAAFFVVVTSGLLRYMSSRNSAISRAAFVASCSRIDMRIRAASCTKAVSLLGFRVRVLAALAIVAVVFFLGLFSRWIEEMSFYHASCVIFCRELLLMRLLFR